MQEALVAITSRTNNAFTIGILVTSTIAVTATMIGTAAQHNQHHQ